MLKVINSDGSKVELFDYPNGEFGIKNLEENSIGVKIIWEVENLYKELVQVLFIKTNMKGNTPNIDLIMDYFPFSREDKYINKQKPLFETLVRLLNEINWKVLDLHSNWYSMTLKENTNREKYINFINRKLVWDEPYIIVYPDKSAYEKYNIFFKEEPYITFSKERKNGKISKQEITDSSFIDREKNYNLILIDDICSYGNTFINAVKETKKHLNVDKVYLFTTYDEGQEKSKEFNELITKHFWMKNINFNKKDE